MTVFKIEEEMALLGFIFEERNFWCAFDERHNTSSKSGSIIPLRPIEVMSRMENNEWTTRMDGYNIIDKL